MCRWSMLDVVDIVKRLINLEELKISESTDDGFELYEVNVIQNT